MNLRIVTCFAWNYVAVINDCHNGMEKIPILFPIFVKKWEKVWFSGSCLSLKFLEVKSEKMTKNHCFSIRKIENFQIFLHPFTKSWTIWKPTHHQNQKIACQNYELCHGIYYNMYYRFEIPLEPWLENELVLRYNPKYHNGRKA